MFFAYPNVIVLIDTFVSCCSLPFVALYLIHAWLFTFDVLLLSRRRARTPVAVGTLCVLFGTLIYVIVTCGNLPQLEMRLPDFDFHNLYFPGRRSAGKQPYVPWEPASGNFGTASCVSEGNNIYPDGQQANQQRQKDMCFLPKKTIAPGISHHILESQQELGTSQERQLDTSGNPQQQLNAAENCQDSGQINFRYPSEHDNNIDNVTIKERQRKCQLWRCCEGANLQYICFRYNAIDHASEEGNISLIL